MNVVGKVGSLITQGVYSVATPFHPFGGAVDIIVVQQQDGTFKTTPWYVQFGKFQGVLKGAEKVVRINVNGVEADFHMYLDNSGEAYFVREGDSGQVPKDERESGLEHSFSVDINQCNINKDNLESYRLQSTMSDPGVLRDDFSSLRPDRLERTDSDACRFYDFQDDQSFEGSVDLSSEFGSSRYDNIDGVDNFVEAQSSDSEMVLVSVDGHILMAPISSSEQNTENVQLVTPQFHLGPGEGNGFCESDRGFTVSENTWDPEYLNDLGGSSSKPEERESETNGARSHEQESDVDEHKVEICQEERESNVSNSDEGHVRQKTITFQSRKVEVDDCEEDRMHARQDKEDDSNKIKEEKICVTSDAEDASPGSSKEDRFKSCLDLTIVEGKDLEKKPSQNFQEPNDNEMECEPEGSHPNVELVADINVTVTDEVTKNDDSSGSTSENLVSPNSEGTNTDVETIHTEGTSIRKDSVCVDEQINLKQQGETSKSTSVRDVSETESTRSGIVQPQIESPDQKPANLSSGFEISICRHLLHPGMGLSAADEAFSAHRISEEEFRNTALSIIKNENLVVRCGEKYIPWDKAVPIVLGKAAFGVDLPIEPKDTITVEQEVARKLEENDSPNNASGRRWRLWPIPFRRVKTLQHSNSNSSEDVFVDSESLSLNLSMERTPTSQSGTPRSESSSKSFHKKILRTNIPTSEQISSLNLKEGQNDVTFSFSTRVLGVQQVEAHIYLWKWNTRIVISDVDGTITKSDVLGQFMPLVGKDWSQSGVARLFCAIKENGYQLLFLSARAIVQAYLTKSFLFNLKQDGKTLPNGPVVISPDGLFPSLFREVIRRAPHEFKIACLEDIKALFPPDYNPFYAGFGNRDTDELTYRKIGIPKGKIFIINPKGEVAINHRIDVKSYTSLHTLVNDMFPPTSMVEQEDYNSWNYWKMPMPDIDV